MEPKLEKGMHVSFAEFEGLSGSGELVGVTPTGTWSIRLDNPRAGHGDWTHARNPGETGYWSVPPERLIVAPRPQTTPELPSIELRPRFAVRRALLGL